MSDRRDKWTNQTTAGTSKISIRASPKTTGSVTRETSDRSAPGTQELKATSVAIEALTLEGSDRYRLTKQVLETALNLLTSRQLQAAADLTILGRPLEEVHLRKGLEKALRDMAHLATGDEKISLVNQANRVRPRTLI
ncbi:MAG: tetratricopeptide repeat protein [Nostoc sp.]|uniref:tetratricopeptide repeat protein n=1 Tax=Nostoc sp. TaxID=1180 RepID=UPI002FF5BB38